MKEFQVYFPVEVIFGNSEVKQVGKVAKRFGEKVFLAVTPFMNEIGITKRVKNYLDGEGLETLIYDEIQSNPSCNKIDEAAYLAKKERCDVVVGIGGGSAIDTAKAVAVVVGNGGRSWDYTQRTDHKVSQPTGATLPIIAVPTTAGAGSETTLYAVLTNRKIKEKSTIISPRVFPKTSIVDPELTISMPPSLTALTGFDTLSHALESYININSHPYSELVALESIKLLFSNLPAAVANGENLEARSKVAWAATLAGMAISHAGTVLPHAMGQPISGLYNAPHGGTIAACLIKIMEYSFTSNIEKFANLAEAMDKSVKSLSVHQKAEKSIELLKQLSEEINLSVSFGNYGVQRQDIPKIVDIVLKGFKQDVDAHPRKVNKKEIENLYYECI